MGCRILTDGGYEAFYCSTTMAAFGPIMYGDAEEFMKWLGTDPRSLSENELHCKYSEFMANKEKDNGQTN